MLKIELDGAKWSQINRKSENDQNFIKNME